MVMETLVQEDVMEGGMAAAGDGRSIQWSSIFAGALAAGAMSFILVGFGVAVGLGVSSASPTWRDASAALALLSGLYLMILVIISLRFCGCIVVGMKRPVTAVCTIDVVRQLPLWLLGL